jgi:hypothetical protein
MISELGEAVASTAIDSTDEVAGIVVRFGSSFLGLSVSIGATPRSGSSAVRSSPEQKGRRMITDHRRPKFPVKAGGNTICAEATTETSHTSWRM